MARTARNTPGGYVYHVLNRGVARTTLFRKHADYAAFHSLMDEALEEHPIRILAYCLMPTHWHFVLWPETDSQMTDFLRWLTLTHSVRWHKHYGTTGTGHLYQNRFKSFPVEEDDHLYTVLRYVERNALRANLVQRAEQWGWSSLWDRVSSAGEMWRLASWPIPQPYNWLQFVNEAQTEAELEAVRRCVNRGRPYGSDAWVKEQAVTMGLEHTIRPRGRPRKRRV